MPHTTGTLLFLCAATLIISFPTTATPTTTSTVFSHPAHQHHNQSVAVSTDMYAKAKAHYTITSQGINNGAYSFQDEAERFCLHYNVTETGIKYAKCVVQLIHDWIAIHLSENQLTTIPPPPSRFTPVSSTPTPSAHTILSRRQIHELYMKYIHKPDSYGHYHKDQIFRFKTQHPPHQLLAATQSMDMPRVFIVIDLNDWLERRHIRPTVVLSLNRNEPELLCTMLQQHTTILDYAEYVPETEENDLHFLDLKRKDYDLIISAQVLEHVQDPLLAAQNMYHHVRPGGFVFTSVPTSNRPHDTPVHFFHLSPMALATIFKRAGFQIIELGWWGNSLYKEFLDKTYAWPTMDDMVKHYGAEASLQNDPLNTVQTWILAQRPMEE